MWDIVAPIAGGVLGGIFGSESGDPASDYYEDWGNTAGNIMDTGGSIWDAGRQRLEPLWTPFGPTPYLSDAGIPEAMNLGMGAYMQGGGAFDTLTDPSLMLDVARNPYVMGAVDAAANEAQNRTAATSFGSGNYGGSMHQRAAAGAIADASNEVLNQAYQQGLSGMNTALQMTPYMTQLPMQQMQDYPMADWQFMEPYYNMVAGFSPNTSGNHGDMMGGISEGIKLGTDIGGILTAPG